MLAHDPSLDLAPRARAASRRRPPPPPRRARAASSASCTPRPARSDTHDPEVLHARLDRVWDACAAAVERHGGTVEPGTGDAIVGLFGLERAQEDDALRALRAAVELRSADELRIGVDAGEVYAGGASRRRSLATGEAVGVAAALAEAARPGEILVGDRARRLAAAAVRVEPLEPMPGLEPKAWRLLDLAAEEGAARPVSASPFVGRERELERLRAIVAEAARERACRLVTVVGRPGLGKSRLARELVAGLGSAAGAVDRPLRPLRPGQQLRRARGDRPRARGDDLAAALGGDEAAAAKLRAATGRGSDPARPEEIAWAAAAAAGARRARAPARGRRGGRPLGGAEPARPARVRGGVLDRGAGRAGLPGAARAARDPPVVGGAPASPRGAGPRPAARGGRRAPGRGGRAGGGGGQDRRGGGGQPAVRRAARGRRRRRRRPAQPAGGARRAHRPARARRAGGARARRRRGPQLPRGRARRAAGRGGAPGRARAPALARPPAARGGRADRARGRGRLPLHPRADPRRRLRRPAEAAARAAARARGGLAPAAREPAARDRRPPPRAGVPPRRGARARGPGRRGRPPARRGRGRGAGCAATRAPPPACSSARPRCSGRADPRAALLPRLGAALFEAGRLAAAGEVLAEASAAADAAVAARARVERRSCSSRPTPPPTRDASRAVADEALRALDDAGACRAWFLRAWVDWTEGRDGRGRRRLAPRRRARRGRERRARALRDALLARLGRGVRPGARRRRRSRAARRSATRCAPARSPSPRRCTRSRRCTRCAASRTGRGG